MAANKRSPNWSDEEKEILVAEYGKRRKTLRSAFDASITYKDKQRCWDEITQAVNNVNPANARELKAVKKKWENLVTWGMAVITAYKKDAVRTGGGPPPAEPPVLARAIEEVIGADSPVFGGIPGGIDSSVIDTNETTAFLEAMCAGDFNSDYQSNTQTARDIPQVAAPMTMTPSRDRPDGYSSMSNSSLQRELMLLDIKRVKEERQKILLEKEVLVLKKQLLEKQLATFISTEQ